VKGGPSCFRREESNLDVVCEKILAELKGSGEVVATPAYHPRPLLKQEGRVKGSPS